MNNKQKELISWIENESNNSFNLYLEKKALVEKDLSKLSDNGLIKNLEHELMAKHYYAMACAYELCKRKVQEALK